MNKSHIREIIQILDVALIREFQREKELKIKYSQYPTDRTNLSLADQNIMNNLDRQLWESKYAQKIIVEIMCKFRYCTLSELKKSFHKNSPKPCERFRKLELK